MHPYKLVYTNTFISILQHNNRMASHLYIVLQLVFILTCVHSHCPVCSVCDKSCNKHNNRQQTLHQFVLHACLGESCVHKNITLNLNGYRPDWASYGTKGLTETYLIFSTLGHLNVYNKELSSNVHEYHYHLWGCHIFLYIDILHGGGIKAWNASDELFKDGMQ